MKKNNIKCKVCGLEDRICDPENFVDGDSRAMMEELNCCFKCAFWEIHARQWEAGDDGNTFFINGGRYKDGQRVDQKKVGGFMGFGGREFIIERFDTGERITSNNLWHQGDVPEHYRSRMPDNAKFIKE